MAYRNEQEARTARRIAAERDRKKKAAVPLPRERWPWAVVVIAVLVVVALGWIGMSSPRGARRSPSQEAPLPPELPQEAPAQETLPPEPPEAPSPTEVDVAPGPRTFRWQGRVERTEHSEVSLGDSCTVEVAMPDRLLIACAGRELYRASPAEIACTENDGLPVQCHTIGSGRPSVSASFVRTRGLPTSVFGDEESEWFWGPPIVEISDRDTHITIHLDWSSRPTR